MEPIMIALAFAAGFSAQMVKLPPLVGFLAAGFALNAMGFERTPALDTIANLGVTLLLFTIGLKLDIRTLLKAEVLGSATLHIVGSTLLMAGLLLVLKFLGLAMATELAWPAMVLLGFALSFSSTVFAVKVLEERSELNSLYGRIAVGILVMQDVFAVIFLSASSGTLPSVWALGLVLLWPAMRLLRMMLDRVGHGDLLVLYGAFLALVAGYALLTLSLTNYSEFGLIVAALAVTGGWLTQEWLVVISLAVAGSFVLAAPLNAAGERLYTRWKGPLARFEAKTLMAADQPISIEMVDAVVLGMGRIGRGAYERLAGEHGLRVLGIDNNPAKLAAHRAAGRHVIEGDAVDSDFWDKLVIGGPLKLVLLAMPSHAGNVFALQQLKHRAFAGRIAAIVRYHEEIAVLRGLGADAVFHISEEAGHAFADDAVAGLGGPGRQAAATG